jgi:hypothetical protein
MPVFAADVLVICISSAVHSNAEDDKDLEMYVYMASIPLRLI